MKANSRVMTVAKELAIKNPKELDLVTKEFSYGKDADNMIGASETGIKLGFKVTNDTDAAKVLYLAPSEVLGQTIDVGGQTVLPGGITTSGVVFATGDQAVAGADKFAITELDADRKIADLRGLAKGSAVQIVGMHFKSRVIEAHVATGPDDSNYENPINAFWVSPFYETDKKTFQLRLLQDSRMNSPQFAYANFLEKNFQALISNEHIIAITVNPRTELTMTVAVGAYDSRPQRFWRATRDANRVLKPYLGSSQG